MLLALPRILPASALGVRPNMWHGQRHPWRSYNVFTFARDVRYSGEAG